jgi:hypothetical protein
MRFQWLQIGRAYGERYTFALAISPIFKGCKVKELCYRGLNCVGAIDYGLQAFSEPSNRTWFWATSSC